MNDFEPITSSGRHPFTAEDALRAAVLARLCETDDRLRPMIGTWADLAVRRCPAPLGDLLEELDFPVAAACARWVATEPERKSSCPIRACEEPTTPCGPFPTAVIDQREETTKWFWYVSWSPMYAADVPADNFAGSPWTPGSYGHCLTHPSITVAIVWLLGRWRIPPVSTDPTVPRLLEKRFRS